MQHLFSAISCSKHTQDHLQYSGAAPQEKIVGMTCPSSHNHWKITILSLMTDSRIEHRSRGIFSEHVPAQLINLSCFLAKLKLFRLSGEDQCESVQIESESEIVMMNMQTSSQMEVVRGGGGWGMTGLRSMNAIVKCRPPSTTMEMCHDTLFNWIYAIPAP